MLVVSALVAGFVFIEVRKDLREAVEMGLEARAKTIRADADVIDERHGLIDADEAFAQVLGADGAVDSSTRRVAGAPLLSARQLASVDGPTFLDLRPPGLDSSRVLIVPAADGRYIVVGATLSNSQEALARLLELFAIALPVALVASSLIGWWLAGLALRPVTRMIDEADRISAAEPNRRLPVPETDPALERLAHALNATLDRLQQAYERERTFADNASHELRTPLTVLKAEVDTALAASRSREELEAALRSASTEIDHLCRIAEGLLVLARANGGTIPTVRAEAPIDGLVEECLRAPRRRAAERCVSVRSSAPAVTVRLDPTRFRQALDNVVGNAIRHVPDGGTVIVTAIVEAGTVRVTVDDSGPGFREQTLAHAFEPFNREPGDDDGTGLGMAIASAIAEAHGGCASAVNRPQGGARVTLTFA
jgi:signal transduction histidine kinase